MLYRSEGGARLLLFMMMHFMTRDMHISFDADAARVWHLMVTVSLLQ